jgi:hypothetical protein
MRDVLFGGALIERRQAIASTTSLPSMNKQLIDEPQIDANHIHSQRDMIPYSTDAGSVETARTARSLAYASNYRRPGIVRSRRLHYYRQHSSTVCRRGR